MTWEQLKAKGKAGGVPWGQALFDSMASFDACDDKTDPACFAAAAKVLKPEEEVARTP